jgi:hypothetical protein
MTPLRRAPALPPHLNCFHVEKMGKRRHETSRLNHWYPALDETECVNLWLIFVFTAHVDLPRLTLLSLQMLFRKHPKAPATLPSASSRRKHR